MSPSYTSWLLDYGFASTVLLCGFLLAMHCVIQPLQRLIIARATAVGLIALAIICAISPWPSWSIIQGRLDTFSAPPRTPEAPLTLAAERGDVGSNAVWQDTKHVASAASAVPTRPTEISSRLPTKLGWQRALQIIHVSGAFGVGLWLLAGAIRMIRLCRESERAPPEFVEQLTKIVGDSSVVPQLLLSNQVSSAVVSGVFWPKILIPRTLEASELSSALAHEWAHIKHGDLRLVVQLRLLLLVLFAHPLFWYFRSRVRTDQELLADAVAAEQAGRSVYAEQLVKWARLCSQRRICVSAPLGIAVRGSQLLRRVQALLDDTRQTYVTCSRRKRYSTMCVVAVVTLLTSFITLEPRLAAQVNNSFTQTREKSQAPTLDEIFSAWAAREQQFRSGRIQWQEFAMEPKGSMRNLHGDGPNPPLDVLLSLDRELIFLENMQLRRDIGDIYVNYSPANVDATYVFDATVQKRVTVYSGDEVDLRELRRAYITDSDLKISPGAMKLFPLAMFLRPNAWCSGAWRDRLQVTDRRDEIDGFPCIAVVTKGSRFVEYWLDTKHGFLLRRMVKWRRENGRRMSQVDVSYIRDDVPGLWRLAKWSYQTYGRGRRTKWIDSLVTNLEINIPIERSELNIEIPEGYFVQHGNGRNYRSGKAGELFLIDPRK